jgi:hypothetical protein
MDRSLQPLERAISAQVRVGASPERVPVAERRDVHLGYLPAHHQAEHVDRKPMYFSAALNVMVVLGTLAYLVTDAVK